jgi:hypothetical protein
MKLFAFVIYEFCIKIECLSPFKRILMFVCENGAYQSEALLRCSTLRLAPGLSRKH